MNKSSRVLLLAYAAAKDIYKNTMKEAKKQADTDFLNKLANAKNSTQFWEAINSLRIVRNTGNGITKEDWLQFFRNVFPPKIPLNAPPLSVLHPYLDVPFRGKAPGPDQIPNDLLKNLPPSWEHYLLNLLIRVLETERVPNVWYEVEMIMLYKKGDKTDPYNYRGIALINTITKLFTAMLGRRLLKWTNENQIIPEEQAGFREKRGCRDHLFTLSTLLNINIHL